jgi:hypothetical protein
MVTSVSITRPNAAKDPVREGDIEGWEEVNKPRKRTQSKIGKY